MKLKTLSTFATSIALAFGLMFTVGCGGGDGDSAGGAGADLAKLESQAAAGDADAAYKAGETHAQNTESSEARIAALKWFYVAQKLGNADAALAVQSLEAQVNIDEMREAANQANAMKLPTQ